ncbi:MAG: 5-(carboxyamino)imidazole ribonucleotide synthase [Microthrixaceae bacterium]
MSTTGHRSGPPVVGILGGGQLARMLTEAATPLGVHVRVLVADGEEGASEVAPDVVTGSADDGNALLSFAADVDVVTIDHENVDHDTLASLEAAGTAVRPSVHTLRYSDKAHQRTHFAAADLPVPEFEVVDPEGAGARESMQAFAARHGDRLVAKASRGGYDGRGVWMLEADQIPGFIESYSGAPLVLEPVLELEIELAVLVARNPSGEVRTWPVLETIQVDGMCDEVVYPAGVPAALEATAREVAAGVAEVTDAVGVLAVELFVVGGEVLVNEIAPRVHNSGHMSIEAFGTSQFEQHLRAVLDWPLGPTEPLAPVAVMANVVGTPHADPRERQHVALAEVPGAHVHLYGKTPRDKRKIGHVTVLGADRDAVRRDAGAAATLLADGPLP